MSHVSRLALLGCFFVTACATPPAQPAAVAPNPAVANSADARVAELFADYTKGIQPGCAVSVMQDGSLVRAAGYGYADVVGRKPITPDTSFNIASTSKQFTAFAVLLLEQGGELSLDDPVTKFVPELGAEASDITLRQLLHHTGGLREYTGLLEMAGHDLADITTREQTLDLIARQRGVNFEPGEQWSYSNTGYFLLSLIVERISGQTLKTFSETHIFAPLGMDDTTIVDDYPTVLESLARGYSADAKSGFSIEESGWEATGDGQVHTTVRDLAKWDENFYTGEAGGIPLLRRMIVTGTLANGTPIDYGFGLDPGRYRGLRTVGHGGAWVGYRSQLLRFPDQHLSVAVLCNRGDAAAGKLAEQVAEVYLGPLMGAEEPDEAVQRLGELAGTAAPKALPTGAYRDPVTGAYLWLTGGDNGPQLNYGSAKSALEAVAPGVYSAFDGNFNAAFIPATEARLARIVSSTLYPVEFSFVSPWIPTDLDRYVGAYRNDEIEAEFEIVRHDGGLALRMGSQVLPLRPAAKGEFESPDTLAVLRFENSDAPKGFVFSTPDIRGLAFRKRQ